jgi:hypothetical protein
MKARSFFVLLAFCGTPLLAQTPLPVRAAQTHSSDIGFSYSLPLDWEIVDTKPMLPVVKQQQAETASSENEKKGIACAQIDMMARYGNPSSVIEAVTLPFGCFGQEFSDKDLPGIASGVSKSLKKFFILANPVYGAYKVGTHSFWIERANGGFISHPETKRTVEMACTVLKKGMVCWMAIATDQESLETFERGAVTLDGEAEKRLVPADALQEERTIKQSTEFRNPEKR